MRHFTLLTSLLFLLTALNVTAQNANFITEVVCESSYKPGQTTELTFKVIPNPGVVNQYDYGHINFLELEFPYGMELVSSSADFLFNDVLQQNPIDNNTISWGSVDGEEFLSFASPFTFSVTVLSHELLDNLQQMVAKINSVYYETLPSLDESIVQVPKYSPINVSVLGAYFESSGNLRVVMMNIGENAFSNYNISYSFNNEAVQNFSGNYNLSPGSTYYATIPAGIYQSLDAEVLLDITVTVAGDISENNNVFRKVVKKGNPLFQNYYGSDFCYSIPSLIISSADESSNEFITADDFTIPSGQTWEISQVVTYGQLRGEVWPDRFAVSIFSDDNGKPGEVIHYEEIVSLQNNRADHQSLNLAESVLLESGRHWISVSGIFDSAIDPNTQHWSWRYTEDTGSESLMYMTEFNVGYYTEQDWGDFMDFAQTGTILSIYGEIATKITNKIGSDFNIYPNPAQDFINLNVAKVEYFKILNASGQLVLEGYSNGTIDISDLVSGCYFISFVSGTEVYNSHFIKAE